MTLVDSFRAPDTWCRVEAATPAQAYPRTGVVCDPPHPGWIVKAAQRAGLPLDCFVLDVAAGRLDLEALLTEGAH